MIALTKRVLGVVDDRKGVTALEYAVIAAGIVLVVAAAIAILGPQLTALFADVGAALQ